MKCGSPPFWRLRDLPALLGIVWSFWSLMVMVISSGRRALGLDPRVVRPGQPDPIAHSSEVTSCLEAYRLSMVELHASAAFALNENSRRHRISTRVDANARAA